MRLRALLALSVLLCSTAAVAGLREGYEALSKKDYVTAANEYRPLAERGDPEAQRSMERLGRRVPNHVRRERRWRRLLVPARALQVVPQVLLVDARLRSARAVGIGGPGWGGWVAMRSFLQSTRAAR